jgi:hypothetical protein
MTPEQYHRGYLLPPGCKDLIDVLRLQELEKQAMLQPPLRSGLASITGSESFSHVWKINEAKLKPLPIADPGFFLEIQLGDTVRIQFLASVLGRKAAEILGDLMELGVFVTSEAEISFDEAAKLLRKYGLSARKRKA